MAIRRGAAQRARAAGSVPSVMAQRQCTKTACTRPAAATLTYVYADQMVVVGQLAELAEPHSYDICAFHAERFTAPRGWDVLHIHQEFVDMGPSPDDLDALARAVREAGKPAVALTQQPPAPLASEPRRGHLRVVSSEA